MDKQIDFEQMKVPSNIDYYKKFFESFDNFTLEMLEFNTEGDTIFTQTVVGILKKEELGKPVLSLVYDNEYIVSIFSLSGNILVSANINDEESKFIAENGESFRTRMLEFIDIIENQLKDKINEETK